MNQKHKTYKIETIIVRAGGSDKAYSALRIENKELSDKLRECKEVGIFTKFCDVFATSENIKTLEDEGYIYGQ